MKICLALLAVSTVQAQGWERVLSNKGGEELYDVVASPDGGYLTVGQFDALNFIYLVKTYADGRLQWSKKFSTFNQLNTSGTALTVAADGSIYIAGYSDGFALNGKDIVLLKTDAEGNLLWQKNYGTTNTEEAFDLIPTTDGGLLIGGIRIFNPTGPNPDKDILLLKTDADGGLVWEKTFGDSQTDEQAYSLTGLPDGGVAIVGSVRLSPVDLDVLTIRTDDLGNQVWKKIYNLDLASDGQDVGYGSVLTDDNMLVIAGYTNSSTASLLMKINLNDPNLIGFYKNEFLDVTLKGICNSADGGFLVTGFRDQATASLFIAKIDQGGNTVWERDLGDPGPAPKAGNSVIEAFDGGAIVAGYKQPYISPPGQYAYMVKTDANGIVFTDQIKGNVFHDFNNNCTQDSPEPGLQDWIVKITKPDAPDRFAVSDANGFYQTQVDTGTYNVQLFHPNAYWLPCQPDGYSVTLTAFYDTTTVDLPVKAAFACPSMQVDIVTPTLIRCEENLYTVSYCNEGTIPAVNAKISVTLDPSIAFLGSSILGVLDSNTTYSFEIGFVGIGQCGTFTINTFLDCGVEIGEAHCVTAHAYPDTFCKMAFPDWDGSILQATGVCENDKVQFKLKNIGSGAMTTKGDFIVIEDVVLLTSPSGDTFFEFETLQPQQDTIVWEGVANGFTRRIIASQTPGYPGASNPTAAVEGCKTDTTGTTSLGFFTTFPDDESEPFKASDCQEVLGFNPGTAKIGHPKGVGTDHWITDSTDLEYLIQFQNTGTDTVFSVEIRDTLSKWLDPTTVKAGAGSAPYDFEIYDGGIVLFRIPNTVLYPVGSVGDGPSSGFVHFRVSQKPITPCDTLIINRAAIFLNDQNPIVTNEVTRKVCNDILHFITVKSVDIEMPGAEVLVFPNPFVEYADFKITGVQAKNYTFELFDVQGKRVLTNSFNHPDFRLHRYQLSPGVFFYRLSANGKPVASGKLIAE